MQSNPLLKILLVIAMVIVMLSVVINSKQQNKPHPKNGYQEDSALEDHAAGDTAVETLNTLTAEMKASNKVSQQLKDENESLRERNQEILQSMDEKIKSNSNNLSNGALDEKLVSLMKRLEVLEEAPSARQVMDGEESLNTDNKVLNSAQITVVTDLSVDQNNTTTPSKDQNYPLFDTESGKNQENTHPAGELKEPSIPFYTIPENATLTNAALMSGLIGRVPIKGKVSDPYPFKAIIGNKNLAVSGHMIPGIEGIVISGIATGDLALSCVRGDVNSLTFIFQDGTIRTVSSHHSEEEQSTLAWLSDPHGNPCISGKFYTNVSKHLAGTVLLGASQGAAGALSTSQTSNSLNPLGGTNTAVTGSTGGFVFGQSAKTASHEVQQWWRDRVGLTFDAVYVPAGQKIVVNITRNIAIDYDPQGRKVTYEHKNEDQHTNYLD